jgi:hypothetical protein
MLINTILVERTIERENLWERLSIQDLRVLTPLFHGHINPYGQFALDFGASFSSKPPDGLYKNIENLNQGV